MMPDGLDCSFSCLCVEGLTLLPRHSAGSLLVKHIHCSAAAPLALPNVFMIVRQVLWLVFTNDCHRNPLSLLDFWKVSLVDAAVA